jgi:hypothetical protein
MDTLYDLSILMIGVSAMVFAGALGGGLALVVFAEIFNVLDRISDWQKRIRYRDD